MVVWPRGHMVWVVWVDAGVPEPEKREAGAVLFGHRAGVANSTLGQV